MLFIYTGSFDIAREIHDVYGHWLLRFPSQCVLVSEAILWQRDTEKAAEKGDKEVMKAIR